MVFHETALDAMLSDSEFEEGEIEDEQAVSELHAMDVDAVDGEVVEDQTFSGAFLEQAVEHEVAEDGKFIGEQVNGDSGRSEDQQRPPRLKKPNKKRSGKRRKRVNVAEFVRETCDYLQEKKFPLVWAAVKKLGVDTVRNLVKEVNVIERCGGQMTNDGKRRRTPGGVLWNILRGHVQPTMYKEIMSQGNEVQKQRVKKAKDSLKRNRMEVDEPVSKKRQKVADKEVDIFGPVSLGKQISQSHQRLRPAMKLLDVTDGPHRDNSLLPAIQVQKAWVDGIRKKEKLGDVALVAVAAPCADPEFANFGTLAALLPETKSVPVFERLRVPVEYTDLVSEKTSEFLSTEQMLPIEHSKMDAGTLCKNLDCQDLEQREESDLKVI